LTQLSRLTNVRKIFSLAHPESPANREFECGLGLEIVQANPGYGNGVQLRLDLQRINRRVNPLQRFSRILTHIYEGRGATSRFVQAVHIISVVEAEGRLHDGQLHDKLDARRAAQPKISVRRDGELRFRLGPGKLLGEILEAGEIQVESAGTSNAIGSTVEERAAVTGPTIGMRYSTFPAVWHIAAGKVAT